MSLYALGGPGGEVLADAGGCPLGLEAKGVSAKVDAVSILRVINADRVIGMGRVGGSGGYGITEGIMLVKARNLTRRGSEGLHTEGLVGQAGACYFGRRRDPKFVARERQWIRPVQLVCLFRHTTHSRDEE